MHQPANSLSRGASQTLHSSCGRLPALEHFARSLQPTLPWAEAAAGGGDWCFSLQLEGASAVHAACESLAAGGRADGRVAVAASSYHGPPLACYGGQTPRGRWGISREQLTYPAPVRRRGEPAAAFVERARCALGQFLTHNAGRISVVLVEPQFGSSLCALPWPRDLLAWFVSEAQHCGAAVCFDEVMCGVGRHGCRSAWMSTAWQLEPDAIVFGKGVSGSGLYPLAGAVFRNRPAPSDWPPHVHTYSAASAPALLSAAATLRALPGWFGAVEARGRDCRRHLRDIAAADDRITASGQGLLWGLRWDGAMGAARARALRHACRDSGVWPYFVQHGLLVTPPLDVEEGQLRDALRRLQTAVASVARLA